MRKIRVILLIYDEFLNYRVIHGELLAIWRWDQRPICQVKLHTPTKVLFCLVFAWQSGNFSVFRSKSC
jgi:hypothetical protein